MSSPKVWLLVSLLFMLMGSLASAKTPDWPHYRAIMWVAEVPEDAPLFFERVREAGCNACSLFVGMDPQPFVDAEMPFYVENLIRGLYIDSNSPAWKEPWDAYWEHRDPAVLIRRPCFTDPDWYAEELRNRIEDFVPRYAPYQPFAWDLRDEPSATTFVNPLDLCFSPTCMAAFRNWLKARYGDLTTLNSTWETGFPAWEEVLPFTADEAQARDKAGHLNFAPWSDHLEFRDTLFADTIRRFAEEVRKRAPEALVGLEGLQMPAAYGGYDYTKLLASLDWAEPYDIGNARAVTRSFAPEAVVLSTLFETDPKAVGATLWPLLLEGNKGCIVWWSKSAIDTEQEGYPLTESGQAYKTFFDIATGPLGDRLIAAKRATDPIAVRYSQADIRAWWLIDSRADGATWMRRFGSYEREHSTSADGRNMAVRLLEDAGFSGFRFVADSAITEGELVAEGYRVLMLVAPQAMGVKEAAALEEFLSEGGSIFCIGDLPSFDEKLRGLPKSPLEEVANHPRFIRLDAADWWAYPLLRLTPPEGHALLQRFTELLAKAGCEPAISLSLPEGDLPPGVKSWRLEEEGATIVALMRNREAQVTEAMKQRGGNTVLELPLTARVFLPRGSKVRELITQKSLPSQCEVEVSAFEPVLLEVTPPLP